MSDVIYWMFTVKIKDGELDNWKALMAEMIEATEANEPGTLNYEWSISEDGQHCHIFERYADSDAALIHMSSFAQNYAGRFLSIAKPTGMTVYGNVSEQARKALARNGAMFMAPLGGFSR